MLNRVALGGLLSALLVFGPPGLAGANEAPLSPSDLLAHLDRYDGQVVKLEGTVEKYREKLSPEGVAYFRFGLTDGGSGVGVYSSGRSPCRNGMHATVEGLFEKVNRLGARPRYVTVTATRVTCR